MATCFVWHKRFHGGHEDFDDITHKYSIVLSTSLEVNQRTSKKKAIQNVEK